MSWTGGRGRNVGMPVDRTPLRGDEIDSQARIAWLLRVNRMASPEFRTARQFLPRLAELGVAMTPSTLSRRERGDLELLPAEVAAYEQVLDLPAGSLQAVCDTLVRNLDPQRIRPPRTLDRDGQRRELDRVDDLMARGAMTGGDWLSWSYLITQPDGLLLPRRMLLAWTEQLVVEMMRALGPAYSTRLESLSRLTAAFETSDVMVNAVEKACAEPGASGVVDAVAVLADGSPDVYLPYLLSALRTGSYQRRNGAALGLIQLVAVGALSQPQRTQLVDAVLEVARERNPLSAGIALTVARRLPRDVYQQVTALTGGDSEASEPGLRLESPAALEVYLTAARDDSGLPEDRMLERVLREALSTDYLDRRHHARQMLGTTPYRPAMAEAALKVLLEWDDPTARQQAALMLGTQAVAGQHERLLGLLSHPDLLVRRGALSGLSYGSTVPAEVDLTHFHEDPVLRRFTVMAAGRCGHPSVVDPEQAARLDPTVQDDAAWWRAHGPALREQSVTFPEVAGTTG